MSSLYRADEVADRLRSDSPGRVRFHGCEVADLFSRELSESFAGVLEKNYVPVGDGEFPIGFVHASPVPQIWSGTMWARDAGTFMRELAHWGYFEHACVMADYMMRTLALNEDGFYTFPEYFRPNERASGSEADGTAACVIGLAILWGFLKEDHPFRAAIYDFLHAGTSPVRDIHHQLQNASLIVGSGEFGGGCGVAGEFCNVVQNAMAVLALAVVASMEERMGCEDAAELCRADIDTIREGMERHLVGEDGSWIWCVDPVSLKPDPNVLNHLMNKGFGGLNGVACMYSDVFGFEPMAGGWSGVDHCLKTLDRLYSVPKRREQFERYGIWTQFDDFAEGYLSAPSYGQGYAIQAMLLFDKIGMAGKALDWLISATYSPVEGYEPTRESRYHFYERMYSPDAKGQIELDAGCAGLNLVNVAEPLKCARLMLGFDDTSPDEIRVIPRLPAGWGGYEVEDWPIRLGNGTARVSARFDKTPDGPAFGMSVKDSITIPAVAVRMPAGDGYKWHRITNVSRETPVSIEERA